MRKLTPNNIARGLRNRTVSYLNDVRSYWHYRNVDYRRVDESSVSKELLAVDLTDYLSDRLKGRPLATYFTDVQAQLRQNAELLKIHLALSDKAVSGCLDVYDYPVSLGDPPEWNIDITGSGVWPRVFFKRYKRLIRGGRGRLGDFRFTWELNRQQHLIGLGLAHALSPDEKYQKCIVSHIVSWIDKNPPFESINWISSMEIGLRLLSWCLSLAQISTATIQQDDQNRILTSIYQQVRFLLENLSADLDDAGGDTKLKNNHTIVELCTLLVIIELFPMMLDSGRSKINLLSALENELRRQTYPDGMHVEQASSYLRFVIEALLVTRLTVEGSGGLDGYIDLYMAALAAFRFDENSCFVIGDEDNGHVLIPCYESKPESLRVVLGLHKALIASKPLESDDVSPSLAWNQLSESTTFLKQSGHWIHRHKTGDSNFSLYFRAGRLDFPEIPGYAPHAHCDLLSLVLAIGDSLWLVDRGTFSYSQRAISDELRYSSAHNTITVENYEQMRILGPFHNDRHAQGRLCAADGQSVKGEMILSDGDRSVTVTREVSIDQESSEIHVHDIVSGLSGESVTWLINLHPDVSYSDDGLLSRKDAHYKILLQDFGEIETRAVKYSPRYGVLEGATQLRNTLAPGDAGRVEKKWSIVLRI